MPGRAKFQQERSQPCPSLVRRHGTFRAWGRQEMHSGGKTSVSRGWEAKVGVGMVSSGVRYMGGLLRALGLWPFVKAFPQHPFNRKSLLCARHMLF